jgi:hypothetical protein
VHYTTETRISALFAWIKGGTGVPTSVKSSVISSTSDDYVPDKVIILLFAPNKRIGLRCMLCTLSLNSFTTLEFPEENGGVFNNKKSQAPPFQKTFT